MRKNGFLTFIFACIPGAGQMYYGYMQRGLSLAVAFCLCCALSTILAPLLILAPVVWMYSFFDTYDLIRHLVAENPKPDTLMFLGEWESIKRELPNHKLVVGWSLIFLGAWSLYDNFVQPLLYDFFYRIGMENVYYLIHRLPTAVVAIVLIVVGLWLLGLRKPSHQEDLPPYPHDDEADL